jgi:hypothetical protein
MKNKRMSGYISLIISASIPCFPLHAMERAHVHNEIDMQQQARQLLNEAIDNGDTHKLAQAVSLDADLNPNKDRKNAPLNRALRTYIVYCEDKQRSPQHMHVLEDLLIYGAQGNGNFREVIKNIIDSKDSVYQCYEIMLLLARHMQGYEALFKNMLKESSGWKEDMKKCMLTVQGQKKGMYEELDDRLKMWCLLFPHEVKWIGISSKNINTMQLIQRYTDAVGKDREKCRGEPDQEEMKKYIQKQEFMKSHEDEIKKRKREEESEAKEFQGKPRKKYKRRESGKEKPHRPKKYKKRDPEEYWP